MLVKKDFSKLYYKNSHQGVQMDSKIRAWLLLLVSMLVIGAVTGVPHLEQPDLVEPIALIVLYLMGQR